MPPRPRKLVPYFACAAWPRRTFGRKTIVRGPASMDFGALANDDYLVSSHRASAT